MYRSMLLALVVAVLAGCATTGSNVMPIGAAPASLRAAKTTLLHPRGIAVDDRGNVYVSDTGHQAIVKIKSGVVTVTLASVPAPWGLALDAGGVLYVANHGSPSSNAFGSVLTLPPLRTTWKAKVYPVGIAYDRKNAMLYVSYRSENASGKGFTSHVDRFPQNGGRQILPVSFRNAQGLAVDGNGTLYVADHDANTIVKIPRAGNVSTVGYGFFEPSGVAVGANCTKNCGIYVADTGHNAVEMIPPTGGLPQLLASNLHDPFALAVTPSCQDKCIVWVTDTRANAIRSICCQPDKPRTAGMVPVRETFDIRTLLGND